MISKLLAGKEKLDDMYQNHYKCKLCSKYGHSHKRCRNQEKCFCGSTDLSIKWNCGTPKCSDCGQIHHARAKQCVFYSYNTELKLLIRRSEVSVIEAKLKLKKTLYKAKVKKNKIKE